MRFVALFVAVFIFLSSLESWAGFWVASRWFVSSRYAGVSLGTVKNLLDRGIINSATQQAKVFVRKNGKWILLTLGLSQVIPEVLSRVQASRYCWVQQGFHDLVLVNGRGLTDIFYDAANFVGYTATCTGSRTCSGASYHYQVPRYHLYRNDGWRGSFPKPGIYSVSDGCMACTFNVFWKVELSQCGSSSQTDWQSERRRVPVRVFPRVEDFVRDDVIANDSVLRWLSDEYRRIANDPSIPTIPSDVLGELELPAIDWEISPDEAVDYAAESSRSGEGVRSGEGEGDVLIPGLDAKLDAVQKKSFPLELVNQLLQNHPLLRVLSSVRLDVGGGGGSCVMGSEPFIIDVCRWQWVLNLMGSFLVPLAFLYGLLGIGGRSDE